MFFNSDFSIFLGIVIIFLAIVYRFATLLITILKNSKCTLKETATIIKFEEKTVSYNSLRQLMKTKVYTPIFQYNVNGKDYTFKGNEEENLIKNIGDEEFVFYDPSNPSTIIRQNDNTIKILISSSIWILVGLSFILYGTILHL